MGDVEDVVAALVMDELEAAGPAGVVDARLDAGGSDAVEGKAGLEFARGGQGEGEVAPLVASVQGGVDEDGRAEPVNLIGVIGGRFGGSSGGDEVGGVDGAGLEFGRDFSEDLIGDGVLGEEDGGSAGAKDAGFFAGDLGEGVAQPLLVVEVDVGDDGDEGRDDIGGVETAAESDLKDGDVDVLGGEVVESHGGYGFEEAGHLRERTGGDELGGGGLDASVDGGEIGVGDGCAVDANAFVDADEMGRGVEGGAVSGGGEDGGEGGGGRAFAVGSGDEDGGKALLGIAECGGE